MHRTRAFRSERRGFRRPKQYGDATLSLLESALHASGGTDRWRQISRFTLHVSITGALLTAKCGTAQLKELAVEGSTRIQAVDITGFAGADLRALYRPDWVALEGPDGQQIERRQSTPGQFRGSLQAATWDQLQLAYYCGYLLWNYAALPFILTDPDFEIRELPESLEPSESLRRLSVVFPPRVVTHATAQTFYFDIQGHLHRVDYLAAHFGRTEIAQMFSAHQRFSGILVPTLSRLLTVGADGVPLAKAPLLDVEIFDAQFE
jgi:hypothetical protein